MKETKNKYTVTLTSADGKELNTVPTNNIGFTLEKFKPQFITGKIVVKVSTDAKSVEKMLFVPAARRIFYNKLAFDIFVRNLERALT